MKIFITGGTGFIGSHLCRHLSDTGHQLIVLSRTAKSQANKSIKTIGGNPTKPGDWQAVMKECDAVVNLAGASIFCRWTEKNRKQIRDSRILTTRNIVAALKEKDSKVKTLINGSAVGYYGDKGDLAINEDTPPGSDFLAKVAEEWEMEAKAAKDEVRVVRCRLGVVLGPDGGALSKMIPPFKAGLGAPLGSGRQWFSWIHIDDLVEAFKFLLENDNIEGPVNLTSPKPVTNRDFSRKLAQALDKPFIMPAVPACLIKLVMGDTSSMVLNSMKVMPSVLLEKGYVLKFSELGAALENLLNRIT